MLEIIKVQRRSDIVQQFASFDAKAQSWLVSDLRTKLEIQNRLLEKDHFFADNSILRATDLWRLCYRREFPKKQLIERSWARVLISNFLKMNISSLNLNQASAATILEMIDFFLPLLSHPEGHDKFREWLDGHTEIKDRWGEWYVLARLCFQYLYNDKDLVLPSWFSSLLIQHDAILSQWDRPLWVDLGGQILWSEAELLRMLSRHVDVKVFVIDSEWQKDFSYKMRPYLHLENHADKIIRLDSSLPQKQKVVLTKKFSGELAEIREAVAQVRVWLDEKVSPQEIGIMAPDIEKYWPVMQCFFEQEGIPVNKESTSKLASWASIQEWLAGLRLRLKDVRSSDLEMNFYQSTDPTLNHEEFRSLFSNILSPDDLNKDPYFKQLYLEPLKISDIPSRDEWLVMISKMWNPEKNTAPLAQVLSDIYLQCPEGLQLPLSDWFDHLEGLVARHEMTVAAADPSGIHLASLMAAPSFHLRKRIFLGLSEDSLKQTSSQFLSRFEVEQLFADLGFFLENHELSSKEFELRLLADAQTEVPKSTRWDDIQNAEPTKALNELRDFNPQETSRLMSRVEMDYNLSQFQPFPAASKPTLSASRVEAYLDCPFKFAAGALFHLRDFPIVDLHIDPRSYGNLVHDLFERLTEEPRRWDFSEAQIETILQEIYEANFQKLFHADLWPAFKQRLVKTAQRFVEFEKQWRRRFPKTQTVGREQKWAFELSRSEEVPGRPLKVQKASADQNEIALDKFYISGKIDRVDSDGAGHLVVIDYKSGVASAENHNHWYEKNKLQLLFYIWALENEVMDHSEVVGAFYYVFKTMERHRGLALRESGSDLFPTEGRFGSLTDKETKNQLLKDLEKTLSDVMSWIDEGLFPPRPREEDLCKTCSTKKICRAPHLN
jgi:ATP-dependent helicase/nuclease subunit B